MNNTYICAITRMYAALVICLLMSTAVYSQEMQKEQFSRTDGKHTVFFDSNWDEIEGRTGASFYRVVAYKNGKPAGVVNDYFISGKPQWTGRLLSERPDLMQGKCVYYYENGKENHEENYINGRLEGRAKYFSENGTLCLEGNYRNGKHEGVFKEYYSDTSGRFRDVTYKNDLAIKVKVYMNDGSGYSVTDNPQYDKATNSYDGIYTRYDNRNQKLDITEWQSNKLVKHIWEAPAKYTTSKEWQAAKKNGVRYFAGTWYGTAPAVNSYQPPTTYRLDVIKSRKGDYYIWKVENSWLGDEQSYCSHGYANEVGFYGDANSFPNVTEMRYEEKADQGIVELCGNFYGNKDCRVLFGYSDDRGWFTVTRTQYVNLKKMR